MSRHQEDAKTREGNAQTAHASTSHLSTQKTLLEGQSKLSQYSQTSRNHIIINKKLLEDRGLCHIKQPMTHQ